MNARTKPIAKFALTAACAALAAMCGCEKDPAAADKRAKQHMEDAQRLAASTGDRDQAHAELAKAAGIGETSDATRAQAAAALACSHYAQALDLLATLNEKELQIAESIGEVNRLAGRIVDNNAAIRACRAHDFSAQPVSAFATAQKEADDRIKAADKVIAETGQQIAGLVAKIKGMQDARTAATNDSASLLDQSAKAQGPAAVDLFKKAQDSRQKAEVLRNQIAAEEAMLRRLHDRVAEAQAHKKRSAEAVAAADAQIKLLAATGPDVARVVAQRTESSKALMAEIEKKRATLTALLAEADRLRTGQESPSVLGKLDEATSAYWTAFNSANKLDTMLNGWIQDNPEHNAREAWERRRQALNFRTFQLARARTLADRATVLFNQKLLLQSQLDMANSVAQAAAGAGLPAPKALDPKAIQAGITSIVSQASELYNQAETELEVVSQAPGMPEHNESLMLLASVRYHLYRLNPTRNQKMLAEAQQAIKELSERGALLPALPEELEKSITRNALPVNITMTAPAPRVAPTPPPAAGGTNAAPQPNPGGGKLSDILKGFKGGRQ